MRKIFIAYFFISFLTGGISSAMDNPEGLYQKGNSSYENKDYEGAVSFYEELVNIDRVSPEVFYNLGNTYFKLKKTGKAILNYERALRLAPRDRDARLNLKLARSMTADKINAPERGFILDAMLFLYDRMTLNELTAMCSAFYLAIILFLIFSINFVAKKKIMYYIAGTFGLTLCLSLLFLSAKIRDENFTKSGIIITEKIDSRSGPREDYLLQFTLHEGTKVNIIKEAQGWYEIDLSRDLKGWIPKSSVDII
ncbi:MAG: tetratricopeptide repeat protein [Candidatus Omnitrophota bacterium]|nr:tetratricopeptide repeat protein [Candidatus Omnitrophota bacterium]